jgi:hypothetical protein
MMFGIKHKPTLAKNIVTPTSVFNFNKQNIDLINKYRNPFKILFLWCIQEIFDIQALLETMQSREDLEVYRKKLMRKVSMNEEGLNAIRPSTTGSVK